MYSSYLKEKIRTELKFSGDPVTHFKAPSATSNRLLKIPSSGVLSRSPTSASELPAALLEKILGAAPCDYPAR